MEHAYFYKRHSKRVRKTRRRKGKRETYYVTKYYYLSHNGRVNVVDQFFDLQRFEGSMSLM